MRERARTLTWSDKRAAPAPATAAGRQTHGRGERLREKVRDGGGRAAARAWTLRPLAQIGSHTHALSAHSPSALAALSSSTILHSASEPLLSCFNYRHRAAESISSLRPHGERGPRNPMASEPLLSLSPLSPVRLPRPLFARAPSLASLHAVCQASLSVSAMSNFGRRADLPSAPGRAPTSLALRPASPASLNLWSSAISVDIFFLRLCSSPTCVA